MRPIADLESPEGDIAEMLDPRAAMLGVELSGRTVATVDTDCMVYSDDPGCWYPKAIVGEVSNRRFSCAGIAGQF